MDELDHKILQLLCKNGRMTVKEIAGRISLTSPAVSERIRRMEKSGMIAGYTAVLGSGKEQNRVDALISLSVAPADREYFAGLAENHPHVTQCFHVTGSHSFILRVSCADMRELETLINTFQKLGQTSTQIILSTLVDRQFPACPPKEKR